MEMPDDTTTGDEPRPAARSVGVGVAVGLAIGLAVFAISYALVAIPVYLLAQSDPNALNRPVIRDALFRFGLPFGLLIGVATGVVVGLWYRRGGHFPTDRTPW